MATGRTEKVTFIGADGESRLDARLDLPASAPRAYALFAHCFTCSKQVLAATRIADGLNRHGIAVLRFDFTGLGASEGEFANTTFASNVGDLIAAASWLRQQRQAPALLIGHSLGGAAVLAATGDIPEAKAAVTIAAPAEPKHVERLFSDVRPAGGDGGAAGDDLVVAIAGRPFRIRRGFLDDIASQRLAPRIAGLKRPLLVVHSAADSVVPIEDAYRIFAGAHEPKAMVALDGADHLLTRREDAAYVADIVAAWAGRILPGDADRDDDRDNVPAVSAPPDAVRVVATGNGKFQQAISIGGRHRLIADEPVAYGGDDSGPGPYDFVLAGLGACTAMTLRMYADRKQIPLEGVAVTLRHAKIHAEDCAECETKEGKIDRIERDIEVSGRLDGGERQRLREIADMCPVHRTLESEIHIVTRLAG
jgi:putative redox protein